MLFQVLKPKYHPDGPAHFKIVWGFVRKVEAVSAADAIKRAKKLKVPCPIIREQGDVT